MSYSLGNVLNFKLGSVLRHTQLFFCILNINVIFFRGKFYTLIWNFIFTHSYRLFAYSMHSGRLSAKQGPTIHSEKHLQPVNLQLAGDVQKHYIIARSSGMLFFFPSPTVQTHKDSVCLSPSMKLIIEYQHTPSFGGGLIQIGKKKRPLCSPSMPR